MSVTFDSGRPTVMTPDRSVNWKSYDTSAGTLFVPEHANHSDVELLMQGANGPILDVGNRGGGIVYLPPGHHPRSQDVVIKEFRYGQVLGAEGHLPTVQANTMLTTGLARLYQRGQWRFRGAEILGALTLDRQPRNDGDISARWILRRAFPLEDARSVPGLPSRPKRREIYQRALTKVGADPRIVIDIHFDDHPENLIIENLPKDRTLGLRQRQGLVTKIDVNACRQFNF